MIKLLKSTNKGFTLVEILIVILTVAVFGSITTLMLANASKIYSSSLSKQKLISESRSIFFKMIREASWQKSNYDLSGSTNKKLIISPNNGNSISYELQQPKTLLHKNEQVIGNNSEVINENIDYTNSIITYKDINNNQIYVNNSVEDINSIELTMKFMDENQSLVFHSKIMPYNFRLGKAMSYHE